MSNLYDMYKNINYDEKIIFDSNLLLNDKYNNIFIDDNNFYKILNEYFSTYLEIYSNGYELIWLYLINIGSLLSGIFVIITKNPVVSVLYLIALFLFISGYLFLIGMSFIGLSYLLVYIGAVSILFLFILMLINVRISELQSQSTNSLFLSFLISLAFYTSIITTIPNASNTYSLIYSFFNSEKFNYFGVNLISNDKWDGNLVSVTQVSSIGNLIYSSHAIWLIIASTILLVAMIGAIIITISPASNYPELNTLKNIRR